MAREADLIREGGSMAEDAKSQVEYKEKEKTNAEKAEWVEKLYDYTVSGNWDSIDKLLKEEGLRVTDKITNNGNTALHVAVATNKNHEFFQKLLKTIPKDYPLADLRNSDGSTLLHVAAMVDNYEVVDILFMSKNPRNLDMLITKDRENHTPLAVALYHMHRQTTLKLLYHINNTCKECDNLLSGTSVEELLVLAISCKDFDLAKYLRTHYRKLNSDVVLTALAQNSPRELNFWERKIGPFLTRFHLSFCSTRLLLVWMFIRKRFVAHDAFKELVSTTCLLIRSSSTDSNSHRNFYINPLFEATKQNAFEVVKTILDCFPTAIWSVNEDRHNIMQYAVINRSEKVYNLLIQKSEHRKTFFTIKDSYGNNLWHLAAKLAPRNKLNLIQGAALQIQRELQWFKEVERFASSLNITHLNSFQETPKMLFTKEHKELMIEGEKWMKTTAESYTITAALITTVVFAAAITVPGGNNQDTGIPIFTNNIAFTIFAVSDAVSLFTSVTSLLMFLSILTARYAEEDFLFKLPTKLIIGLATLFISTTAMIIAFSATLFIVFGQKNSLILIPIVALTCIPITSFVTMQFPLVVDLISATYGRSIFGKNMKTTFHKKLYDEVLSTKDASVIGERS